ncbi:LPXTG cell wall anchor domain-containing protein [Glycomyces paridis]|uniref:LPXTG cell wall anchor domain-containing protein n=1 Tax=Glycomyces paridis TaxID=2126555 RepID=A0A4S8P2T9_9ACTN|nr:LPXTG cell wall anchor domain-containing protein [Glycomyces paridis]THV24377.1 LPXTG cell wall anchor domain-containing protein [Glycomyces paridis]
MSTLKNTGLRLAAAGAAAALTLAAASPAFAQETETPADDATTAPAGENTEAPATDEDAEESTEETTEEAAPEGEDGAGDGDIAEEIEEDTEEAADEEVYQFAYLDHLVTGANVGETVSASPQVYVEGAPSKDRVATLIWFTDTVDYERWLEDWFDFSEVGTGHASVVDEYDNCDRSYDGMMGCIVTGWNPESGKTYQPSAETPIDYLVEGEVDYNDIAVYSAFDLTQEDLDFYLDLGGYDLEGANQFALAEAPADETAPLEYFFYGEGWISFEADIDDIHPNLPGGEDPALPTTGASQGVMIGSAAAAVLAGALVFFFLRRRKTAANWE